MAKMRESFRTPHDDGRDPSVLEDAVLGLLEAAGIDTATNDKIVTLIEAAEIKKAENDIAGPQSVSEVMPHTVALTYGKSNPWNSGWKGWSDRVDVFLEGKQIGTLYASDCPQKRYLEYGFVGEHPLSKKYPNIALPIGLKAAKEAVARAFAKVGG